MREIHREIYDVLKYRIGVNLDRRLKNKQGRMARDGIAKSKWEKVNKLDVISDDKKLIEVYVAVVKEMAIAKGVADTEG